MQTEMRCFQMRACVFISNANPLHINGLWASFTAVIGKNMIHFLFL